MGHSLWENLQEIKPMMHEHNKSAYTLLKVLG